MHDVKGFSIIELMVTITIAGILIAIAAPSFTQMIVKNQLRSTSNELAEISSVSRSEALKRNKSIVFCRAENATAAVCKDGAHWEFWIIKQNSSSTVEADVISRGAINTYGGNLKVSTNNINNSSINFGTDGLARSGAALLSNAQIVVCTTKSIAEPIRHINLGAANQVTITQHSGACQSIVILLLSNFTNFKRVLA